MGHKSVITTEVYSEMNLKRVAQDFPDLVQNYVNKAKKGGLTAETAGSRAKWQIISLSKM